MRYLLLIKFFFNTNAELPGILYQIVYIHHQSGTPPIKGASFIKRSLQETVISYLWNWTESPDIWLARDKDNMSVYIYMSICNQIEIKYIALSDSTHHFFRNVCTKSGSLRFSQFSGCWLILSVYIIMSFDFPFVGLFGVR